MKGHGGTALHGMGMHCWTRSPTSGIASFLTNSSGECERRWGFDPSPTYTLVTFGPGAHALLIHRTYVTGHHQTARKSMAGIEQVYEVVFNDDSLWHYLYSYVDAILSTFCRLCSIKCVQKQSAENIWRDNYVRLIFNHCSLARSCMLTHAQFVLGQSRTMCMWE